MYSYPQLCLAKDALANGTSIHDHLASLPGPAGRQQLSLRGWFAIFR